MTTRRLIVLLCLASVVVVPSPGNAGCAGPTVDARPSSRRAGETILVTGDHWVGYCNDTGELCAGCTGCTERGDDQRVDEVQLELVQQGTTVARLETVDVFDGFSFAVEVRLPRDLEPGRYRIVGRGTPSADHAWTPVRIVD